MSRYFVKFAPGAVTFSFRIGNAFICYYFSVQPLAPMARLLFEMGFFSRLLLQTEAGGGVGLGVGGLLLDIRRTGPLLEVLRY